MADNPDKALKSALRDAAGWDGVTLQFSLDADADELTNDTVGMGADEAEVLLNSTVTVSGTLKDDVDPAGEVKVTVDGIGAVDFRQVDDTLYVRSDVDGLIERFADDSDEARAAVDAARGDAAAFGLGDAYDAIVAGSWVQLDGVDEIPSVLGVEDFEGLELTDEEQQAADALYTAFTNAFKTIADDLEVEHVGSDSDAGDHLQVTVSSSEMLDALMPALEDAFELAAQQQGLDGEEYELLFEEMAAEVEDLDDVTIPFNVWVKDGQLTQVGFDVVELLDANAELGWDLDELDGLSRLQILATVRPFSADDVTVPQDAVKIDLADIFEQMMGAMMFGDPMYDEQMYGDADWDTEGGWEVTDGSTAGNV